MSSKATPETAGKAGARARQELRRSNAAVPHRSRRHPSRAQAKAAVQLVVRAELIGGRV
jgi:hypothetical protein